MRRGERGGCSCRSKGLGGDERDLLYLHMGLRAQAGTAACLQARCGCASVRAAAAECCRPQSHQRSGPLGWRHICLRPSLWLHVEINAALGEQVGVQMCVPLGRREFAMHVIGNQQSLRRTSND